MLGLLAGSGVTELREGEGEKGGGGDGVRLLLVSIEGGKI